MHGQGKGFFEYRLILPEAIAKARPEAYELRLEVASKAGRQRVDWPQRVNKLDTPQTDVRTWPSTLEIAINGHVTDRRPLATTRPTRGACSPTWLASSTAAMAS